MNKNQKNKNSNIDYRDVVGKIYRITFLNNSKENLYLLKPSLQNGLDSISNSFTASVHLIQVSNDSLRWENVLYRQAVDIYDADYDTLRPKSKITKFTFLDNNRRSKYLKLLLEYRSDSSYFNDTIQIANIK